MLLLLPLLLLLLTHFGPTVSTTTDDDDDLLFDLPLPAAISQALHSPTTQHLPPQRWFKAGQEALAKPHTVKNLFSAAYFFTAASHATPQFAPAWHKLALSLSQLASGFPDSSALVLLCESKAAARLADVLGHAAPSALPTIGATLQEYAATFPLLCEGLPSGKQQSLLTHAFTLETNGKHLEATRLLCRSASITTITVSAPELKRGILTAATARKIWITARICGVLRLSNAVPTNVLTPVKQSIDAHWEIRKTQIAQTIADRKLTNGSLYYESDEIAMRGDTKRYELQLEAKLPYTHPLLTNSPFVRYCVTLLTNDAAVELDTFSYVHSLPGSVHQPWHVDVASLFPTSKTPTTHGALHSVGLAWDATQHTHPFGMVAVVPLIDVDATSGPTEFITGSHVAPVGMESYWKETTAMNRKEQVHTTPVLSYNTNCGDVILFDLRLMHRGTPNVGKAPRSILYMSYVRSWYQDPSNFKRPQSASFDRDLNATSLRKLFTRVDSKTYTRALEELIEKRLGKHVLQSMKSQGEYAQRSVRL